MSPVRVPGFHPQSQTPGERGRERAFEEESVPCLQPSVVLRRARLLLLHGSGPREGDLRHHRTRQERPGEAEETREKEKEKVAGLDWLFLIGRVVARVPPSECVSNWICTYFTAVYSTPLLHFGTSIFKDL